MLQAEAGDGTGPDYIDLQVATTKGVPGYELTAFCPNENGKKPVGWARFKAPIRFLKIEGHENPSNDFWEEKGQGHKVFPHALFVGQGIEHGRPVTVVWTCGESEGYKVAEILKVFNGNAKYLDGPYHGSKEPSGLLVEHARASWLSAGTRPGWSKPNQKLKRYWTYRDDKFSCGAWTPG